MIVWLLIAITLLLPASGWSHSLEAGGGVTKVDEQRLVQEANIAAAIKLFGPSTNPDGSPNEASIGGKSLFGFNLRWPIGTTLRVCMWQQDKALRVLIARVASEWLVGNPNLHLDFGDVADPRRCSASSAEEIRITDEPNSPLSPYWSHEGTQSKLIPAGQPTMDLGFGGPSGPDAQAAMAAAASSNTNFRNYFHFVVL